MEKTLIQAIDDFCVRHDMPDTRFGELALNDKPFVSQLRAGRDVRMSTVAKVVDFILTYAPVEEAA